MRLVRPTLMNINSIRQETYKGLSYSPALMSHFAIAREMAKDGELNANAIIAQAPEFGPERTNQLLDDVREADKEENKAYREARKQAGQRVYTTYSNDDGDVLTKQMFKYLGGQLSVEVEKGLEAKRYFSSILDNLYSEALRKEGGNIGPVLIDNLILEAEEKTQKYMKEKYPPNMIRDDADGWKHGSQSRGVSTDNGAGGSPSWQIPPPVVEAEHAGCVEYPLLHPRGTARKHQGTISRQI